MTVCKLWFGLGRNKRCEWYLNGNINEAVGIRIKKFHLGGLNIFEDNCMI